MPPPSPVLPYLVDKNYGVASDTLAAQQLLSILQQQQQQQVLLDSLNSSACSGRKSSVVLTGTDYINVSNNVLEISPRKSTQDYPIFSPHFKSFEEFILGTSMPPGSIQSGDSLEASRDDEWLSPLALDSSSNSAFSSAMLSSLKKSGGLQNTSLNSSALSSSTLIHRKKAEKNPYHTTSRNPNLELSEQKPVSRNRSTTASKRFTQADCDVSVSGSKKPVNELSNSESIDANQNMKHLVEPQHTQQANPVSSNNESEVRDDVSEQGCLQSCDNCLPGSRISIVPLMDSRDYTGIPPKERNFQLSNVHKNKSGNHSILSWFKSKKKTNHGSQTLADGKTEIGKKDGQDQKADMDLNASGIMNQEKDGTALVEVFELKAAIQDMSKKLENLETYCQALQHGHPESNKDEIFKGVYDKNNEIAMPPRLSSAIRPTKKEFYHAVTEARLGIKQLCRTLLQQIQEQSASEKIESILQPYNVRVAPRVSKNVRYHLESLISEAFYEDFENIKFQRSGTHFVLDPRRRPQAFYNSYLTVAKLSWNELVNKDSDTYSKSFDAFCDQKMNRVEEVLSWEGRWPDELARSFFVAAKWVWLLHLLAFSFENPAVIFRVGSDARFDSHYMEELHVDQSSKMKQNGNDVVPPVRVMVMPGFFFDNYEVIKCKVLLSRPSVTVVARPLS